MPQTQITTLADDGICACWYLPLQVSLNKEPETCAATAVATVACIGKISEVLTGFKPFKVSVIIRHSDHCFSPNSTMLWDLQPISCSGAANAVGDNTQNVAHSKHVCSQVKLVQWHGRSRVTRTLPSFFRWEVALRFIWSIWCFVDGSVCWFRNPAKQLRLVLNIPLFTVRVA